MSLAVQAVRDGSLAQALGSLRSQPQVLAAYSRTAPVRDRQRVMELQPALLRFKARFLTLTARPCCCSGAAGQSSTDSCTQACCSLSDRSSSSNNACAGGDRGATDSQRRCVRSSSSGGTD